MASKEQEVEALSFAELNNVVYAHSNTAVTHFQVDSPARSGFILRYTNVIAYLQVSNSGAVRIHSLNSQPKCAAMSYFELFPN